MELSCDCYGKALAPVERIEDHLCNIPNIVNKRRYDELPHMWLVLSPNVSNINNITLFLEQHNCFSSVYAGLARMRQLKPEFCNDSVTVTGRITKRRH